MTAEAIDGALEDLYGMALDGLKTRRPRKIRGEAYRIYYFGFEVFKDGFLRGLKAGIGAIEEGVETCGGT